MKCSVVVPLFNKAATVARSLESIRSQTFKDFEVIVVDDGSTDSGAERVEAFLQHADDRFRMIRQSNAGPGAARNRGIQEAKGELVAFLDADDEWLPDFLEKAIGRLLLSGAEALSMVWFDEPGHQSSARSFSQLGLHTGVYSMQPDTDPRILIALLVLMWPCTTIVRKEIAERYGGFYEKRCKFSEDAHLWLKVCLNHAVYVYLEEGAVFHRENSALSGNYRSMRDVEPFLTDPDDVRTVCPPPLSRLLDEVLAIRAMKTACVLAYWGQWRKAVELRNRFEIPGAWRLPWFFPSLLAASPLGAFAGTGLRALRGRT